MARRWIGRVFVAVVLACGVAWADDGDAPKEDGYTPRTLAPALKDQAVEALGAGKHEDAISLFERWLAADPRDATSWYNLACARALAGKRDAALDAFETAIDAGFDDLAHAREDADLASIRESPRFGAALVRGEAKEAGDRIPGLHRHALATQTIGTYVALLPPDYETSGKAYPVVVILHGSGSSEIGHARAAEFMGREGVIYVCPRALHPHEGVFLQTGKEGWTAWPPVKGDEADDAPDAMALYADWVMRCIADARRRYRVQAGRVHVWGHSQGAAAAMVVAALHPEQVEGCFAYAAYYPEKHLTDARLADLAKWRVRVELCHGTKDRVVPPGPTHAMKARLDASGVPNALHVVEAEHRITEEVERHSRHWADRYARRDGSPGATQGPGGIVVHVHEVDAILNAIEAGKLGFEQKDGGMQPVAIGAPRILALAGRDLRAAIMTVSRERQWVAQKWAILTSRDRTLVVRAAAEYHDQLAKWLDEVRAVVRRNP